VWFCWIPRNILCAGTEIHIDVHAWILLWDWWVYIKMVQVNKNMLWHDFCDYTCDKNEIEPLCVVEWLLVVLIHYHDTNIDVRMFGSSNVSCLCWKWWFWKNLGRWTYRDVFVLFDNVWWMECGSTRFYVQIGWETLVGGKPVVSLTLGRKKEVELETTPSSQQIFESAATWITMIISESAVNHMRWWF
jgi:hypothetical protein